MTNDDLRDVLRTAAESRTFLPVDPSQAMLRGERVLRRRRFGAAAGALVTVGAIVTTALVWIGSTGDTVPVPDAPVANFSGTSLPGAGGGDQALAAVTVGEALRRCTLQWSAAVGRPITGRVFFASGAAAPLQPGSVRRVGSDTDPAVSAYCTIPGDTVPSPADLALAQSADVPTDQRELLRRCSAKYWHDITGWKVLTTSSEPEVAAGLVAQSPSGKYVAYCFVSRPDIAKRMVTASTIGAAPAAPTSLAAFDPASKIRRGHPLFGRVADSCNAAQTDCVLLHYEARRLPEKIASLEIKLGQRQVRTQVSKGYFIFTALERVPISNGSDLQVAAFDRTARKVSDVIAWPLMPGMPTASYSQS